jgi:hypothetical protein
MYVLQDCLFIYNPLAMRNISALLFGLLILYKQAPGQSPDKPINVQINKNVELLGFGYFIGFEGKDLETSSKTISINGKETPVQERYAYGLKFYREYKSFAESKNLAAAFSVADHLWLDYLINFLVQLDDFPDAKLPATIDKDYYINFSKTRDTTEARKNVLIFLENMNLFYKEVDFDKYLSASRDYYNKAIEQVRRNLPDNKLIVAMEDFYKKEFNSYTLIPSLTIPAGMGFGIKYTKDGKTRIHNVFGTLGLQKFKVTDTLDMGFANRDQIRELSTHEFGHSFVNYVVANAPQELITGTEHLFDSLKQEMSKQGYTQWKSCLYEHFVRACEVVIAKKMGYMQEAENLKNNYINNRKFIYLPLLIEELDIYSRDKKMSYQEVVNKAMNKLKATTAAKN